jgi:tetrahydromethanopterin S-methyltransferase subunit D
MKKKTISYIQFIIGLILALTGAALMFFDLLSMGTRITIGIVGLLLIATSRRKMDFL